LKESLRIVTPRKPYLTFYFWTNKAKIKLVPQSKSNDSQKIQKADMNSEQPSAKH